MRAAQAIAMLDRQLARNGQTVTLRRVMPGGNLDQSVLAFVRGYKPDELIGTIEQGDEAVTLSPTGLAAPFLPPVSGDRMIFDGRVRTVEMANPVKVGETVVRYNLQVRG